MNPIEIRLDGSVVEPSELLRLEVERARRIMALMMRKLGPQGMADLFAAEIRDNSEKLDAAAKAAGGRFHESVAFGRVREGSAREFIDWFSTTYAGPGAPAMQRAHPEHLGALRLAGDRVGIIEVPGHSSSPAVLRLALLEVWDDVAIPLDPERPERMMGRFENAQGEAVGYLLHQFRDTHPGFEGRFAIYWPEGVSGEIVAGHGAHLAIEWNNWLRLYLRCKVGGADLVQTALSAEG